MHVTCMIIAASSHIYISIKPIKSQSAGGMDDLSAQARTAKVPPTAHKECSPHHGGVETQHSTSQQGGVHCEIGQYWDQREHSRKGAYTWPTQATRVLSLASHMVTPDNRDRSSPGAPLSVTPKHNGGTIWGCLEDDDDPEMNQGAEAGRVLALQMANLGSILSIL